MANFEQAAGFEHGFWLQILGDHARFIHDSLAPQEKQEIEQTRYFIQVFDQLLRSIAIKAVETFDHQKTVDRENHHSFDAQFY